MHTQILRFLESREVALEKSAYLCWGVERELKVSTSSSTPLHSSQIIDLPPPSTQRNILLLIDININCVCGKLPMCLRTCLIVNDMFVIFIVLESHHLFHFLRRWWMIWLIVDVFSLISVLPFDSFRHSIW